MANDQQGMLTHRLPEQEAMNIVQATVESQKGVFRDWHVTNWTAHAERYRADLRLVTSLGDAAAILEVGSAPCHMTALLHLSGHSVVGVDRAPGRVADFIEQMNLDVRECDIERAPLPFADGRFLGVLLCETFEHLRVDPAFVISEINRVLAPGGFLLLTTPNVYSLPSLARHLTGRSIADPLTEFGKLRGLGHMGHVREYSSREVIRFVQAFGLTVQSVGYRYHENKRGRRERILGLAYKVVPRRFHRDIVLIARKTSDGPCLAVLP